MTVVCGRGVPATAHRPLQRIPLSMIDSSDIQYYYGRISKIHENR